MRPNLSLSNIAATLAALGTSAVLTVACGGATPPAATEAPAQPAAVGGGQKSCSANGCGASSKGDKETTPATTTATVADPNANNATATPTASAAPTTAPTAANLKPAPKPPTKTGAKPTGQSSCGAGTCAADPKKK